MKTSHCCKLGLALQDSSCHPAQQRHKIGTQHSSSLKMNNIAEGVDFDTIAREWRCKWSSDDDKKSLVNAQKSLEAVLLELKAVKGVKNVQRVVCGGCLDFKVVTSLTADTFSDWEGKGFAPESKFLEKLKSIDGISQIETQTYTLMPM